MAEKELTDYQIEILKSVVSGSVKAISYHKPQMQLKGVVKNKNLEETLDALRSLESDFGVLVFDSTLRFGIFSRCGYRANLDKAKKLYDSYARERGE